MRHHLIREIVTFHRSVCELRPNTPLLMVRHRALVICMVLLAAMGLAHVAQATTDDMVLAYVAQPTGADDLAGVRVLVDDFGYVYVVGRFRGTVDFDPGPGTFYLSAPTTEDIFIYKIDPSGAFVWARAVGGSRGSGGFDIAVDRMGNVVVSGYFQDTVDFDPGPGNVAITASAGQDAFVLKLDASGNYQWVSTFSGNGNQAASGIAVDDADNIYCTGHYNSTTDFDPGPGVLSRSTAGMDDIFICKLDSAGGLVWVRTLGGAEPDVGSKLVLDSTGRVCIAGFFGGSVDFDPGAATSVLTSAGNRDGYALVLDSAGSFQWAGGIGGPLADRSSDIAVNATGDVYMTGSFQGTADFDPGAGVYNLTSAGGLDVFVARWSATGTFQWASAMGSPTPDEAHGLAVDANGNAFTTGRNGDNADFDPGPGVFTLPSFGIFVSKLDATGQFAWTGSMAGSTLQEGYAVAADGDDNVYVTGYFRNATDFDPGPGDYTLYGNAYDAFVQKLEPQALPLAGNDIGETLADRLMLSLVNPSGNSVLANDTDANTRDNLSVTAFDATSALGATIMVNPDGTFVYDPTAVVALQALDPGVSLSDTFTYTISDGLDSATGTVTITVFGKGTMVPTLSECGLGVLLMMIGVLGAMRLRGARLRRGV